MATNKGVKLDSGKNRLGLVFRGFALALLEVGKVGTFGANKYTDDGWQSVKNGKDRYFDALFRHILAHYDGKRFDEESNLPHLAHAAWNALAILNLDIIENSKVFTPEEIEAMSLEDFEANKKGINEQLIRELLKQ